MIMSRKKLKNEIKELFGWFMLYIFYVKSIKYFENTL